ncbi:MAG: hypothetical protein WCE21_04605 [Candidatus Babeliales bacterium]
MMLGDYLHYCACQLTLFSWRDGIELMLFAFMSYWFIRFLAYDKNNNLVIPFYGLCAMSGIAATMQLTTVTLTLTTCMPSLMLIFYIIHEKTMRKNITQLMHIHAPSVETTITDWPNILVQASLQAQPNQLPCYFIIERTHSLSLFLENGCPMQAPLSVALLQLFFESSRIKQQEIFYLDHTGMLKGVHISIHSATHQRDTEWFQPIITETDALIIKRTHDNGYTAYAHNTVIENISASQTIRFIKQYCFLTHHTAIKEQTYGTSYPSVATSRQEHH